METTYSSSSQVGEDDVFYVESRVVLVWSRLLPKAPFMVTFVYYFLYQKSAHHIKGIEL